MIVFGVRYCGCKSYSIQSGSNSVSVQSCDSQDKAAMLDDIVTQRIFKRKVTAALNSLVGHQRSLAAPAPEHALVAQLDKL